MKEFGIEDGLERILELAKNIEQKPVLIAVCGRRNSGKSFLGQRAQEKFNNEKIKANASYDKKHHYESALYYDYLFIHAPLMKTEEPEQVSECTQKFLGRPVDIFVYIYDPKVEKPDLNYFEKYNVVIKNPGALDKELAALIDTFIDGVVSKYFANKKIEMQKQGIL